MIRKVRRKFIILAMIAIIACTTMLVVTINLANYYQIDLETTDILKSIAANNGQFPVNIPDSDGSDTQNKTNTDTKTSGNTSDTDMNVSSNMGKAPNTSGDFFPKTSQSLFSLETQYETRYFTVRINSDGTMQTDLAHIVTVDETTAEKMVEEVQTRDKKIGYIDNFKYYISTTSDGNIYVVMMDCQSRIASISSLATTSGIVAVFGILAMFLFITLMSKRVIRPVIESMEKQKQFITDASHELKTPLTVIATNMDILTMDLGENEWVGGTQKQVSNLRRLVNNLVSLSRLEEESTKLIMENFNLSRAVQETAEPFASMAEYEGKSFTFQIDDNIEIQGDESAVRQLTGIFCDNAVKYSSQQGDIKLTVARQGKKAVLVISNQCDEMVEEHSLGRLFDRFYRADAARSKENGKTSYGVGLAIAKAIVEKQGGRITVTQDKEKYITFKVHFS